MSKLTAIGHPENEGEDEGSNIFLVGGSTNTSSNDTYASFSMDAGSGGVMGDPPSSNAQVCGPNACCVGNVKSIEYYPDGKVKKIEYQQSKQSYRNEWWHPPHQVWWTSQGPPQVH